MPPRNFMVNNGFVDARDPSLIGAGELIRADDCYYKENNPSIFKVSGRVQFNAAAEASRIIGGRYLEFDNGSNLFVISVGTTYRSAPAGLTGSFSNLVTGLTPGATTLDSIHYNNQFILLDGVNRARVVDDTGTATFLGMLRNVNAPTIDRDGGAGAGFTMTTSQSVTYWVEERVKSGSTILRRNASNSASNATLTGDGTSDSPRVTRPAQLNTDATHWALFGTSTATVFPNGNEISEVPIATTFIDDLRTDATVLPSGEAYQTVAATIAGITQTVPRNDEPPIASTGDVFEDSIILNDTNDPSLVVFSFVDNIHAYPSFNFFRFETKDRDVVRNISTLDNILVALLRDSAWRINSLPRPEDSSFTSERFKAQIHGAHGCVGPKAAAKFSFGDGLRLAYVSKYGVLVTDGSRWDVVTDDIDWENNVNVSQLSRAFMVNKRRRYRIVVGYPDGTNTRNTKQFFLHYHPSHAKTGLAGGLRSKVTGPINRDSNDEFIAEIGGVDEVFSANEDGRVYRNDSGDSEPTAPGGIDMVVRTGDQYVAGVGNSATLQETHVHHQAAAGQNATVTITQRVQGEVDEVVTQQMALDNREATPLGKQAEGQAFQFGFRNNDQSGEVGLDFFTSQIVPTGRTEER